MDEKKVIQRVISVLLIAVFMMNYCDTGLLRQLTNLMKAQADELTESAVLNPMEKWIAKADELNITVKVDNDGVETGTPSPKTNFWADTSGYSVMELNVNNDSNPNGKINVATEGTSDTSVGYRIMSTEEGGNTSSGDITADNAEENGFIKNSGYSVNDKAFAGTTDSSNLYYTIERDKAFDTIDVYDKKTGTYTTVAAEAYYRRYYVSTAAQLSYLLYVYNASGGNVENIKSTVDEIKSAIGNEDASVIPADKIGIVLLCDLDLGRSSKKWQGYKNTSFSLEIDGNGHTIYNGHLSSGFLGNGDYKFAIHDVTFSRNFIGKSNGMFGSSQNAYFRNVNWEGCVAAPLVTGSCATIVLGSGYTKCYFKNCFIRNCYARGGKATSNGTSTSGHSGMFASYNGGCTTTDKPIENSTNGTCYYSYVPDLVEAEVEWNVSPNNKYSRDPQHAGIKLSTSYPSVYENCAAIDCGVYETAEDAFHSGTFVSCVQSGVIFRNCFSNSSIYGQKQLGGFVGAVIGSTDGFTYTDVDDSSKTCRTSAVFENCYSSGVVEGKEKLGGFIGMVFDDFRATGDDRLDPPVTHSYDLKTTGLPATNRGKVIFKNCHSTASVGMASSADYIGGFIGVMRGNRRGAEGERKHRFINCYAAGEVGGVANSLDTAVYNTETIGGFIGLYCPEDYDDEYNNATNDDPTNKKDTAEVKILENYQYIDKDKQVNDTVKTESIKGIFTNCYYDKQTTAMREREVGAYPEYVNTGTCDKTYTKTVSRETYTLCYYPYEKTEKYYKLTDTLDGITGVYTQQCTQKTDENGNQGIKGLTDNVDMNGSNSNAWINIQGYYPQLKVFAESNADDFDGDSDKALVAKLSSQASAATVFLDHYDKVLDYNSGIDGLTTADYTRYDTVRDITSEFSFTSDGNTTSNSGTNVGWRINTEKNKESSYYTSLGGVAGFDVDFDSGGNSVSKNYTSDVVVLTPNRDSEEDLTEDKCQSNVNGGYVFHCYEFSVGKQFVEVVACENNTDDASHNPYGQWEKDRDAYSTYLNEKAKYDNDRANYIRNMELSDDESDDVTIENRVLEKIGAIIKLDDIIGDKKSSELDAQTKADVKARLRQALKYGKKLANGTITDDELEKAQKLYLLSDNNDGSYTIKQRLETAYDELGVYSVYPFAAPDVVTEPEDFSEYAEKNGDYGKRTFRLIPTAYIDAGDMINIGVGQDETKSVTNEVTLLDGGYGTPLDGFDHTVGVIYVSTQDTPMWDKNLGIENRILKTRLIDYSVNGTVTTYYSGISNKQNVNDLRKYYAERQFNTDLMDSDSVFALYNYYPGYGIAAKTEEQSDEDYQAYVKNKSELGFNSMTDEVSLGNFYPQDIQQNYTDPDNYVGRTQVKVHKANVKSVYYNEQGEVVSADEYDSNEGTSTSKLQIGDEVDMSDEATLAKWSGRALFTIDDEGYYYMTYYWRLTDGRYISADKLVHIDASSYTVDMITGVADATDDTFHNGNKGDYTEIDCAIGSPEDDDWESYQFPSDVFKAEGKTSEEWLDYANATYNYAYGFTYPEDESDYSTDTTYWAKGVEVNTNANNITVAWRKNTDYSLTKLIIMVRKNYDGQGRTWLPMNVYDFNANGSVTTLDDSDITYSYAYSSYSVTQDSRTKLFSVIETANTVKKFEVVNANGLNDATVKSIQFKFVDGGEGSESNVKLTDDVKVIALFKTVAADVQADKYVLIDDGKGDVIEKTNDDNEPMPLYLSEAYRSVDNNTFDEDLQRAVLFGDKLIYRMRVHNDGVYNANSVVVKDDIPDGCTLITDSVKILRQEKTYNRLDSTDRYGEIENIGKASDMDIGDALTNDYEKEQSIWYITSHTDEDTGKEVYDNITWLLNPVSMNYDYYVQYEVTVDSLYNKFKEVADKDLVNKADFTYAYINGSIYTSDTDSDSVLRGENNDYYAQNAVFNVTSIEDNKTEGEYDYSIDFDEKNSGNTTSYIQSVKNELPIGYKLKNGDTSSIKVTVKAGDTVKDVEVTKTTSDGGKSFEITPTTEKSLFFGNDANGDKLEINVSFTIERDSAYVGDVPVRRENEAIITFYKNDGLTNNDLMKSSITKVDSSTNEVRSAVRWLYLNVEKDIPEQDDNQVFLFKVVNDTTNDSNALLTDITASIKSGDKYIGDSLIEITKRGEYVVKETDWSATDYDMDKVVYNSKDIDIPTISDDLLKYEGDITTQNGADGYVKVYLPRAMYTSTAFPLWAVEDSNGNTVYPTVFCSNTPSEYAWLSAQQSVENSFTLPDKETSIGTNYSLRTVKAKAATSLPEDDVTTPPAVVADTNLGGSKKDEDEE